MSVRPVHLRRALFQPATLQLTTLWVVVTLILTVNFFILEAGLNDMVYTLGDALHAILTAMFASTSDVYAITTLGRMLTLAALLLGRVMSLCFIAVVVAGLIPRSSRSAATPAGRAP